MTLKSFFILGLLPRLLSASVTCSFSTAANDGDTCQSFATTWGMDLADFKALNPGVDCPALVAGQSYCVIGTVSPDPTTTTTTTTSSSSTTTTTLKTTRTGPSIPSPTQPGLAKNCDKFYLVQSGDQCGSIEAKYGISESQFQTWNPFINDECSNLWLGYYVCVHVPGATTTSSTPTPTPTGPQPQMPGIVDNCDQYYLIKSGDRCDDIEGQFGITEAQFLDWNTAINDDCSNLWLDYYVCVHVPGAPTSTGPQPQMPGIVDKCKDFHKVQSGDSCYSIEQANGITLDQFLAWNTKVNAGCSNLWLGYYVCVGV